MLISWIVFSATCIGAYGLLDLLISPSWPDDYSSNLKDGAEFDYIVVGAGGGGVPAATRLAAQGHQVLLIEAGKDPSILTRIPMASILLLRSDEDWQTETISNGVSCLGTQTQTCKIAHGKALGGGTSINFMMYVRGNRQVFDSWNITGWTSDELEQYFLKYEGLQDIDSLPESDRIYHNTSGILPIGKFADPETEWHQRLITGFTELNFPLNVDLNGLSQIGVSNIFGYVYDDERSSTATAYLTKGTLPLVAKNTLATGIIIDENLIARGVTVSREAGESLNIYAKGEVILSAGAINTPQLLMLSGVGPSSHLNDMGITVRSDLPVGKEFVDHVTSLSLIKVDKGIGVNFINLLALAPYGIDLARYLVTGNGPFSSNGLTDITALLNTECYDFENSTLSSNPNANCELPDLQYIHFIVERNVIQAGKDLMTKITGFNDDIVDQISLANVNNALILVSGFLQTPVSRGWIELNSTDPRQRPNVFPNFLSEQEDVDRIVKGIRIVQDLVGTPTFKEKGAEILILELEDCPEFDDSDAWWECYVRHATLEGYHPQGTAGLGRVVDEKLRVIGIERLRVADNSILPTPLVGNTAAFPIAVGERVAEFVSEDNLPFQSAPVSSV